MNEQGGNGLEIMLDFMEFSLCAKLFDTLIADRFYKILPVGIDLVAWGKEFYGDTGADLGAENPVDRIPPGGIAYTNQGNYLCIFFGQNPAWPVEHIGQIERDSWKRLVNSSFDHVIVTQARELSV